MNIIDRFTNARYNNAVLRKALVKREAQLIDARRDINRWRGSFFQSQQDLQAVQAELEKAKTEHHYHIHHHQEVQP